MLTLSALPDELRIPLDRVEIDGLDGKKVVLCEYPGVVAVVRPPDLIEKSRWNDAFPNEKLRSEASTRLVLDQLLRIEGFGIRVNGTDEPFDVKNPIHQRSIPFEMRNGILFNLRTRMDVSEAQSGTGSSPASTTG